ncbi:hypothetical protein SteCoe_25707 [Stentor coeruleus]|uniref:NPHP4 Ig-like domain-containing protein n=1 Tax=Stentor coeruleus TaxID=5963 RepID=A0A1R2BEV3_9CILI|nr:hypothetical protein SteCoe_25707 [Stentor coeruleus]
MLRAELEKVFIEHCVGCKTHQWCTNHDEDKYIQYFTMCKNTITRTCSRVTVSQNEVPLGFQDKFVADPNISHLGKYHFPRIGAFEVYFRGKVIFSKIESMKWPNAGKVAEKIKEIQEAPPQKQLKKKVPKPKRIKSALTVKKKKGKKGRKKHLRTGNNDKIVSINSEDIQDRPVSRDQQLRGVRNYKQAELPNFSANISHSSGSDQDFPSKDYYNPQAKLEKNKAKEDLPNSYSPTNIPINKAKEPNLILDKPKDPIQVLEKPKDPTPVQKQPTPVVKQENFPVAKSPTPMTKVVKSPSSDLQLKPSSVENIKNNPKNPYDTSSESSSDNYGYSSEDSQHGYAENDEHINYLELMKKYPDNFKQEPETNKFAEKNIENESKNKENFKSKKEESKESSNEYSKDYEDERFEKNKKFVKKSDDEEDYSDDDYEDDKKGDKESDDEEYSDEDYEADSGRGSQVKSSSSSNKKESKGSSKKDDYEDSDFEEEQAHPLRPIDKSYNVKLPLGEESKKKITYQNMSDSSSTFLIESSHPDYMSVKDSDLHIEKGKKGKIQLRFAPMMNADEKKYYLYVDRNGQPWECIEIIAEYED